MACRIDAGSLIYTIILGRTAVKLRPVNIVIAPRQPPMYDISMRDLDVVFIDRSSE